MTGARSCLLFLAVALLLAARADVGHTATKQESNVEIVAIDLEGRQTNLTHDPAFDVNPAVARDGRIVFLSTRAGYPDLYVMDGNGRNIRRLTNSPFDGSGIAAGDDLEFSQASWSPNGKTIAFDGEYQANGPPCEQHCAGWDVLTIGADGSGLRQVAPGGRAPAWSPDGRRLAYESGVGPYFEAGSVTIARFDGSASVTVKADNPYSYVAPVWSPDGGEIAFQAVPTQAASSWWIYTMRTDGKRKRRLAEGQNPAWSPNGRRLAFVDDFKLITMNSNGKGKRRLSRKGEFVIAAAWSPKGGTLAYIAGTKHTFGDALPRDLRVETVSGDGKRVHVLVREPASSFIWSGPVWTPGGKRILIATDFH